MKYLFILNCCLFICWGCANKKSDVVENTNAGAVEDTTQSIVDGNVDNYQIDPSYYNNLAYKDIKIFEPRAYAEEPYVKQLFNVMDTLIGIFDVNSVYKLKYCWITKVNVFEQECSGLPFIEPTMNTKEKCVFLFKGLKTYNKLPVDKLAANWKIWVGETKKFTFNNMSYELKGEGRVVEDSGRGEERFQNIRDYKLYLTSGGKSQCIVEMKYFQYTMTEIRWIGDIDGDGKLDFIISSPDNNETNRIILLLSSYADNGNFVKTVSITVDSFAC